MLKIYVSTNCGQTWTLRYSKSGSNMSTGGIVPFPFTPTVSQWRSETVSLYPFQNMPDVRFKFQNTNRGGNNLFVDDINIHAIPTGIADHEMADDAEFTIFPNPASGQFDLEFFNEKVQKITFRITDALGREVKTIVPNAMPVGENRQTVDENLDAGIYFISLIKDGASFNKRLLVTK